MPIYKTKGGYRIKNVRGVSRTKTAARKRLAAIKISQKRRGKR